MNPIEAAIHQAEEKWLSPVNLFITKIFTKVNIPSHDALHHHRVWAYSKMLIKELHSANLGISPASIESTLVAAMFHDTGLTTDLGEKHGSLGVAICKQFLVQNPQLGLTLQQETFDAIEKHDDKSLKENSRYTATQLTSPLLIVSTADDLDAFGYIGVFRYLEIYLKRGIAMESIPKKVIENINNRYANFRNRYFSLNSFTHQQRERFTITLDFFSKLDDRHSPHWQIALFIASILKHQHTNINQLTHYATNNCNGDTAILNFFRIIAEELNASSFTSKLNTLP
ncbi:MAG: HD domain-containing protein [Bacteroidales bacterium]|nr:HD domain-containing protein [Bacteroidales bacterium]MBN2749268.1 HD domain-containing protein [Bacteroidales bacterium]